MLRLADVHVVFNDFESEDLIGKWYVNFDKKDGFGSVKDMTEYFAKEYESKGKKVMYLSIWQSEKIAA